MKRSRILVVDDEPSVLRATELVLTSAGFNPPVLALNADVAYALLGIGGAHAEGSAQFDLILMDIAMPGIDGIEAAARIRLDRRYRGAPIILFSAYDDPEILQQVFLAGAHDFLAKPLNRAELVARIQAALRFKREVERRRARELQLQSLLAELRGPLAAADEDQLTQVASRQLARVIGEVSHAIRADDATVRHILEALTDLEAFAPSQRRRQMAALLVEELLQIAHEAAMHSA